MVRVEVRLGNEQRTYDMAAIPQIGATFAYDLSDLSNGFTVQNVVYGPNGRPPVVVLSSPLVDMLKRGEDTFQAYTRAVQTADGGAQASRGRTLRDWYLEAQNANVPVKVTPPAFNALLTPETLKQAEDALQHVFSELRKQVALPPEST